MRIDIVMTPVDGVWTLNREDMIEVLPQIKPKIMLPMHIFTRAILDKFLTRIAGLYRVENAASSTVVLSRSEMPEMTEILVLPGG